MSQRPSITLIGCGKMGSALLSGWLDSDINADFSVIDPQDIETSAQTFKSIKEASKALQTATMIILATKPQIMAEICADLAPHLKTDTAILSIAAGQSLNRLAGYFADNQPVIRAMPNTPAAIGKGITVAIQNPHITDAQAKLADQLLSCAGALEWIKDETLLDAVTAISGSGPAYIFHLIETLAKSGEKQGLPADLAMQLARQTVIGAAALAEHEPNTPASALRENVTSPGGTTASALDILMNGELQDIYNRAIDAATKRGKDLNA